MHGVWRTNHMMRIMPKSVSARTLLAVLGLALLGLGLGGGCAPKRHEVRSARHEGYLLVPAREAEAFAAHLSPQGQELASWLDLRPALLHSLDYLRKKPQSEPAMGREDIQVTWGRLARSVERLLTLLPRLDREPGLLAREFEWLRLGPEPVFTGYYAPVIEASLTPDETYRYPLFAVPPDLKHINLGELRPEWRGQVHYYRLEGMNILPYHTRREIELEGVLKGRNLEIAWARDPLDLFYLHVQGSGYLQLPDGRLVKAQYGSKNGRPFKSISQVLLERGYLRPNELSRARIAACLKANPDVQHELLAENESFIFFRLGDGAPQGAMQRPLTPMVSLASDPRVVPLGGLMAFATDLPPDRPGGTPRRVLGLGLAQDAGSAIQGNRFDLYCGIGKEREHLASHIKTEAAVHLLLSREPSLAQGEQTYSPKGEDNP